MHDNLVMIGEIVRPHGILGEVKVYTFSEQPENFRHYKQVVLQSRAGSGAATYKVMKSRVQGKLAILQLEGVVSREAAKTLQGKTVWLAEADLPVLNENEYYWHQLLGLQVYTENGRKLGKVAGFFTTRAHDVLVINGGGQEYLIPVKEEIIARIDKRQGKLLVTPLPGLLEANAED